MNKNTKRVLSAITVVSLSVTSFTGNIQNVVNAKEEKQEENALSTNRVNAEVLENEAGAVIRVSASSNVQNVKTTYSVDTAGSKVVSFGDLKAGEVKEIQVNFEEDSNKLKSLPKTTAVSDRVDFNKEVRGHKIKGSVSFEYDNGDTAPVVTPTVPTTPTKPVVTTPSNPTAPTNPVVTPTVPTKPINPNAKKVNLNVNVHVILRGQPRVFTVGIYENVDAGTKVTLEHVREVLKQYNFEADKLEGFPAVLDKDYAIDIDVKTINTVVPTKPMIPLNPTKPVAPVVTPVEPTKPVTPAKPLQPVIPDTPDEPVVTPEKPAKPVAPVVTPTEPTKPVVTPTEPTKPVEPAKPVEPVTPAVTPADTGLEAGMPANVKWSRAQLKEWGFTFGKITGNYNVDGDLGVFDNEDGFDKAWKDGSNALDKQYLDGKIDDAYFKNTPHGYSWNSVTKPDGTTGYAMYLYDNNGVYNDGQKAR